MNLLWLLGGMVAGGVVAAWVVDKHAYAEGLADGLAAGAHGQGGTLPPNVLPPMLPPGGMTPGGVVQGWYYAGHDPYQRHLPHQW